MKNTHTCTRAVVILLLLQSFALAQATTRPTAKLFLLTPEDDRKTGAFHFRIERDAPVALLHGWYTAHGEGGKPETPSGAWTGGSATTKPIEIKGKVASENNELLFDFRVFNADDPVPAIGSVEMRTAAEGEMTIVLMPRGEAALREEFVTLYKVEFRKDGKLTKTFYHIIKVTTEPKPKWDLPKENPPLAGDEAQDK
ncbi:MAG TPA: hypothetical protein VF669_05440 [Tepidisphaeraceae bacterium]|jgi:hypothetical protein